ncbi:Gfo/Idh/MocA family protein [Paenibacillus lemnae]|uniref:Gfo/Idh/MocA family oxidoreductase n=1 Tax=Paenibacillus lemnae TaxID=1330551 RepID=A0A848M4U7_PAELE|nr:Gfo/Idh/MocA family oxidoreductase [Paenibacillus lemnae]NMO95261.1 Gfo/Idh/MocA family oxidoreductase [Paenibacillus lemnae]
MIRVAIIGMGNISTAHIRAYIAFPERCQIAAFVDIDTEKARSRANQSNLEVEILESHQDLLGRTDIDLVSICTPPFSHADIAVDLLSDNKHVLVEKPMATSLEECDRMIAAAEKSGALLSVVAQNRFLDPVMHLKDMLDSGKIGRVVHAQVDSHWWRGHCYYDLWWRGLWSKEGGGCTLNHAVHHIDMLGWMMGMPKKVVALLSNASHDNAEIEDISIAALQYDQGSVAQVTSSVIHHGEEQQIIFQGEYARISAPWKVYASTSLDNGFPIRNEVLEKELHDVYNSLPPLRYSGHEGQIDNVLTALETGAKPLITGESGRMTIELITAIYKAGFQQKSVELPIAPDDPYYKTEGILDNAPRFYEKAQSLTDLGSNEDITLGSSYSREAQESKL